MPRTQVTCDGRRDAAAASNPHARSRTRTSQGRPPTKRVRGPLRPSRDRDLERERDRLRERRLSRLQLVLPRIRRRPSERLLLRLVLLLLPLRLLRRRRQPSSLLVLRRRLLRLLLLLLLLDRERGLRRALCMRGGEARPPVEGDCCRRRCDGDALPPRATPSPWLALLLLVVVPLPPGLPLSPPLLLLLLLLPSPLLRLARL